jgi:hypothetical protein
VYNFCNYVFHILYFDNQIGELKKKDTVSCLSIKYKMSIADEKN